ncbi:MAG: hypothetical protein M1358_11485 [Chloroflexi bacterium]|nr:hypothetical protein [Chloroflexota bacterium]
MRPLLQTVQRAALALSRPYLTLCRWEGQNQGGALTASYAGFEYAKPSLKSVLFDLEPTEHEAGHVPIWSLNRLVNGTDADVSYVVADEALVRRLPPQGALVMPFRTQLTVDVRGEWERVVQRFHRNLRQGDLRRARKYGYTYETSDRKSDFEMFYHTMYVPTMANRHGALANFIALSFVEAFEYFRRGVLLLVKRDQRFVAGVVLHPEREIVYAINLGVAEGSSELIDEFAMAAVYLSFLHWANEHGFDVVDLWGSPPQLTRLFFYKRKWGAMVGISPTMPQRIWLKIRRDTPAVRQFLLENPPIILDDLGRLWGLIVTKDGDNLSPEQKAAWHSRYDTPGLEGLQFCSAQDLINGGSKYR